MVNSKVSKGEVLRDARLYSLQGSQALLGRPESDEALERSYETEVSAISKRKSNNLKLSSL